MPFTSPYSPLTIEPTNVLDYVFPAGETASDEPVWIDSQDPKKALSPKQGLQWIKRTAFGLRRLGLDRGDVVMLYTTNHIFIPPAYYGIVGGGMIFSAANPAYTVSELVHQMKDLGAKVLLVHPDVLGPGLEAASEASIPRTRIFQFSDVEMQPQGGIPDWRSMLGTDAQGDGYQWPRFTPEESRTTVATINFSSGTTGLPKGVCVSHFNLVANTEQSIFMRYAETPYLSVRGGRMELLRQRPPERYAGFLPLYHAFGQSWILFVALRLGIATYIMPGFRYEAFLDAIQRHRITTLQVPPPVLVMLSKRPETGGYDLSSLRDVLCGAAPLSRELQNECVDRFGVHVMQGWGMTELTCGGMLVPGGVRDDTGSVGLLLPGSECMLVGEDGLEVAQPAAGDKGRSEPGELYVRGPQVCLRYWRNEEATSETLSSDGWLKTGDICVVDGRGYFWVVDRKKELIKVNGLQVAPAELEAILLENEHVSDSAVVGITTDEGEWPRAYCSIQPSSKGKVKPGDIQEWIKSRVAKHKHLVGGVVFVDEIPRLASGKIQRKVMRDLAKRDAAELKKAKTDRSRL